MSSSQKTINIVCAFNEAYGQHAAVMISSLFKNNKGSINVHCLVSDVTEKSRKKISSLGKPGLTSVRFHDVDVSFFRDLYVKGLSVEAYFRLLIPQVLKGLERALYLDVDLVVVGDIRGFYEKDFDTSKVIAVIDPGVDLEFVQKLNPLRERYFNSGVMLLDISAFNESDINQWMSFARLRKDLITYHDQCVLNYFEICQPADVKYNLMSQFYLPYEQLKNKFYSEEEIRQATSEPRIVHYNATFGKPWQLRCSHPRKWLYFRYMLYTPWRWFAIKILIGRGVLRIWRMLRGR